MKTNRILIATALAALLPTMSAQAGVLGMADLTITSLVLVNTATNLPVVSGLSITSDSRTGSAASDYNGVTGTGVGASSITAGGGLAVDVKYRCAGPDCGAIGGLYGTIENNTTTHLAPPATLNYALGDMFISGSALSGGANGLTRANASAADASNQGGSSATIQNSARVTTTFTVADNFTGALVMGADAFARAFVDAATPADHSTFASGSLGWNASVRDVTLGLDLFSWIPSQLNKGLFASISSDSDVYSFTGNLVSPPAAMIAGHTYTLVITQSSLATVSEIPEPETLALVGMAFLGLGVALRSRRRG